MSIPDTRKRPKQLSLFSVILLVFMALARPVTADQRSDSYLNYTQWGTNWWGNTGLTAFPILELPLGGRHEAMGGAFTAAGPDVGALNANPAATATLRYTELALSHKNHIADSSIESLGYAIRLGDLGLGVDARYLHVPFTARDDRGRQTQSARYSEVAGLLNVSYNLFRSYYFHGLSVGLNTRLAHRSIPETISPGQSVTAAAVDFGLLTRFNVLKFHASRERNLSLGFAARNFGLPVLGDPLPTHMALGLAYRPVRPLLIAIDGELPVSLQEGTPPGPPALHTGMNVQITDFFDAGAGFRLRGGNPRFSLGGNIDFDEVSLAAVYTLDLTTSLEAADNFSVQARFNFGDRGRLERRERLEDLYLDGIVLLSEGEISDAVSLLEEAVALDPSFDPAVETLASAQRSLQLQQGMFRLGDLEELDQDPGLLLEEIEESQD
ncbi:MAG: UPF0164 family protein [Spirochaetaceae bacterium]